MREIIKDRNSLEIKEGHILSSGRGIDSRICEVYSFDGMLRVRYKPHNFDGSLSFFMMVNTGFDSQKTTVGIIG